VFCWKGDGGVSKKSKSFKNPLMPFEEYYAILKVCVEDPTVIASVHRYFELENKYYEDSGDPLSDAREESTECYNAFNDIGFAIDKLLPKSWRGKLELVM
jgi:hypothetical protein